MSAGANATNAGAADANAVGADASAVGANAGAERASSPARLLAAAVSGIVFAVGLALSGMTNPAKVIGFLDVAGAWDPSLAFVMGGAIGAHFLVARWAMKRKAAAAAPLLGGDFDVPDGKRVDGKLLAGAALFGLGWGASGYCPGPALVGAASLAPTTCLFLVVMVATIALYRRASF